jgi:hypothetical protein
MHNPSCLTLYMAISNLVSRNWPMHPDYFRRGAGTMLAKWGMELAEKNKWAITVFAGPMAYGPYERLGFKTLGIATTQGKDEEEKIEFPGMVWEPSDLIKEKMGRSLRPTRLFVV